MSETPDRRPAGRMLRAARVRLGRHPRLETVYRVGVGVAGGILTLGGLVLVPLPGPGWLVVFLGLAVLGTEFRWARRAAAGFKRLLGRLRAWRRAHRAAAHA